MSLPNPTIAIDFARSKRLPSSFTFSRNSAATYVDNNGYVQYVNSNAARFDHTPIDGTSNGLLIEESRTNLFANTSTIETTYWSQTGALTTVNRCAQAPDGTFNATLLQDTNTTNVCYIDKPFTVANDSATYCFSIFLKQGTAAKTTVLTYLIGGTTPISGGKYVVFDWSTKTIDAANTNTTYVVTPYSNGWYRISVFITNNSTGNTTLFCRICPTLIGTYTEVGTVYAWGPQVEVGTFPTSYIPSADSFSVALSTSTYFDSTDGILKKTPTNLLTYSQDFTQASWTKFNLQAFSSTGSLANIAIAPDGTQTASKLVESTAASTNHAIWNKTLSVTAGQVLTYSIYVKAGERTRCSFVAWVDGTHYVYIVPINLSTQAYTVTQAGMTTGSYSFSMVDVGYGWYQIIVSLVAPVSSTVAGPELRLVDNNGTATYTGDGVSGLYAWGAQVSLGINSIYRATDTIPLDQSSLFTRPHYNPYTGKNTGALLEPASTNLATYSEQFDNAAWSKNNSTVTANQAYSPDGLLTADRLVDNTTNASHNVYFMRTASNETVTFSCFIKAGEYTKVQLQLSNFVTASSNATYDLAAGTVIAVSADNADYTNAKAFILPYPNGWYRCILTSTKGVVNTNNHAVITLVNSLNQGSFAGTGISGFYIWGAQVEMGASATSYIPTIASTVTRAADSGSSTAATRLADNCYINVGSWYNQTEGTVYVSNQILWSPTTSMWPRVWQLEGFNPNTDRTTIFYNQSPTQYCIDSVVNNVGLQLNYVATITANSTVSSSVSYKLNASSYSFNGAAIQQDTACNIINATRLILGCHNLGAGYLNGTIAKFYYWPKKLADTDNVNLSGL